MQILTLFQSTLFILRVSTVKGRITMTLYLKRFWKENVGVLFFLTLTAICQTLSSIRISSAFNALEDQNVSLFFWRLLQVFGIFLLFLFFTHLEIKIKSQVQQKMATAIR